MQKRDLQGDCVYWATHKVRAAALVCFNEELIFDTHVLLPFGIILIVLILALNFD